MSFLWKKVYFAISIDEVDKQSCLFNLLMPGGKKKSYMF